VLTDAHADCLLPTKDWMLGKTELGIKLDGFLEVFDGDIDEYGVRAHFFLSI
jgi:hypothetical protein